MKLLTAILVLALFATGAMAQRTVDYDWETGGSVLGIYSDMICTNVDATGGNQVHAGTYALRCEDAAASGTPQGYVGFVWGLQNGDEVTASFYRYDDTPGVAPNCRIWGHWNDSLPGDPSGYDGSASGQSDYGPGLGWDQTSHTWTAADGHTGLVIEVRTYSSAGHTVWIDDLQIIAPEHCWIQTPGFIVEPDGSTVSDEFRTFGDVKVLYR